MDAKYVTYTAIELASEPAFQAWAMSGESDEAWQRWINAHPDQSTKITEARKLLSQLQLKTIDTAAIDRKSLWNKIDQATGSQTVDDKSKGRGRLLRFVAAAAAACIAALLFININSATDTTFRTQYAQVDNIQLPDNSQVQLNADSKLVFDEKNWPNDRSLTLDGEAFFNVQKGERFVVSTSIGTVEVLGTSFNVYSRDKKFEVICKTGKVAVRTGTNEQILTPGEKASLTPNGELQKTKIDNSAEIDWIAGVYNFENTPLSEVMKSVQRQFDYDIQLPNEFSAVTYTGQFQSGNIDTALYQITWPLNLNYELEGKKVIIKK